MLTIYKHEMKLYIKTLLIWFICVGGMGFACILLFSSMQESMEGMAESFATMGAFSDAFGMSQLSIGTLIGFYATEIGTIHGLGGAMFAAIIASVILSKEEDGHTSEFLFSLPVSRSKVITAKWCAATSHIFLFNIICVCIYVLGFLILGEEIPTKEFLLYHIMQVVMQLEIAGICFCMSSFMKKNKLGAGLGSVLLLYGYDLMARVIPDLSDYKIISPFSYANAADILSTGEISVSATVIGVIVLLVGVALSYVVYTRRDLAA
ncbi:MAG: ABC transporter permease subunit [Lachnospiraceae bacterium]